MLGLCKELSHIFLYLVLKVTQGLHKIGIIFPRGVNQGWGTVRDPQELSGDLNVTEDVKIIQEIRKKRKESSDLRQAKGSVFKRAGRGIQDKEVEHGEEGIFCEKQTSELNIDPWQNMRTNHYGLICELGDKQ